MKGQRLRRGMHIKFGGQRYSIESRLSLGDIQLKHLPSETLLAKPEAEILKALFEGAAELLGANGEVDTLLARRDYSVINDFGALEDTDPRKREALRRLSYVDAIRKDRLIDFGKNAKRLKPVIERVSKSIQDPNPPSCVTAYRWYKAYTAAGDDIRVLAPAYKARGRAKYDDRRRVSEDPQICKAVDKIIEDVISEHYMQLTRPTTDGTYDLIVARIVQDNRFRSADDQLPVPHKNTIYRRIKQLDAYEKDKARYGKRSADLRHKVIKQGVRPTRPLERVEMDETKLDLFVVDEKTNLPLGRPWLVLLICAYTKMILGYYLSFERPSYLCVMQALLHSIRPKTYVRELYPEIVHSWDAYGLPELLVVDNAKQYYSASFDEACLQLGMITQYAPVKVPYYKPSIERTFGILNTQLLHQMPGTTFSNIAQRWDYDPKKHALISIQQLDRYAHIWIIDVYHQKHHRGINDVPARRWELGTKDFPPALPFNAEELNVLLGHIEHRCISNSGVEMWGLLYNHPSLTPIKSHTKKGERVKIKFDPTNISLIHVYDRVCNRYLPVPAAALDYADGLSLWQHKVIKREARLSVKDYVDLEELCLAKARIQQLVNQQFTSRSKSSSNVKVALWQNIHSRSGGHLEISDEARNGSPPVADDKPTRFIPHESANFTGSNNQNEAHNMTSGNAVEITNLASGERATHKKTNRKNGHDGDAASVDASLAPEVFSESTLPDESQLDSAEFESDYALPRRKK